MKLSTKLKWLAVCISVLIIFVGLFLKIFYPNQVFYGFQTEKIPIIIGLSFCLARIVFVLIEYKKRTLPWTQILLPLFISTQLILLYLGQISILFALIIIPIIELAFVICFVIYSVKAIKDVDDAKPVLYKILGQFFPTSILKWVIIEITLFSMAFYGISRFFRIPKKEGWTYSKNSDFPVIFTFLILFAPIEIFAVHYLFNIQNIIINGILIFLYIASFLYIYGFWVSIKLFPHQITENEIFLFRGVLAKTQFPISFVKSFSVLGEDKTDISNSVSLTVPGGSNVELILTESVKIQNLIGKSEQFVEKIFVSIDEPEKFYDEIQRLKKLESITIQTI